MKLIRRVFLWLAWPAMAGAAAGETLSIDWYSVDGGGAATSDGEFTLSGTVGQPDAGVLACPCSRVGVIGGYWSRFVEYDQPDGPRLCIRLTGTNTVLLSWPDYHVGYVLETHTVAVPVWIEPIWIDVPATPIAGPHDYQVHLDDLAGFAMTVCTNAADTNLLETSTGPRLTGFEWYRYTQEHPDDPMDRCRPSCFYATNAPTFFRLRKP